jgi:hypothetical protein
MSDRPLIRLIRLHGWKQCGKAFLTGLLFFLLLGGILVTPTIVISMLYVPYIVYFLLAIYVQLSLSMSWGLSIMSETLRTLAPGLELPYRTVERRLAIGFAIVVFIALSIVYLTYLD